MAANQEQFLRMIFAAKKPATPPVTPKPVTGIDFSVGKGLTPLGPVKPATAVATPPKPATPAVTVSSTSAPVGNVGALTAGRKSVDNTPTLLSDYFKTGIGSEFVKDSNLQTLFRTSLSDQNIDVTEYRNLTRAGVSPETLGAVVGGLSGSFGKGLSQVLGPEALREFNLAREQKKPAASATDITSQLKEAGKKGPFPTVNQDILSQLKEAGKKGPFPTVDKTPPAKPGATGATPPAGEGKKPEEIPDWFKPYQKQIEQAGSQSKNQPSPVPSDISVPRGQSSSEAAFPLNEFEDLLFRMEASKGRQKRQESIEGRRNIFAQGLAQMMSSAF